MNRLKYWTEKHSILVPIMLVTFSLHFIRCAILINWAGMAITLFMILSIVYAFEQDYQTFKRYEYFVNNCPPVAKLPFVPNPVEDN